MALVYCETFEKFEGDGKAMVVECPICFKTEKSMGESERSSRRSCMLLQERCGCAHRLSPKTEEQIEEYEKNLIPEAENLMKSALLKKYLPNGGIVDNWHMAKVMENLGVKFTELDHSQWGKCWKFD